MQYAPVGTIGLQPVGTIGRMQYAPTHPLIDASGYFTKALTTLHAPSPRLRSV